MHFLCVFIEISLTFSQLIYSVKVIVIFEMGARPGCCDDTCLEFRCKNTDIKAMSSKIQQYFSNGNMVDGYNELMQMWHISSVKLLFVSVMLTLHIKKKTTHNLTKCNWIIWPQWVNHFMLMEPCTTRHWKHVSELPREGNQSKSEFVIKISWVDRSTYGFKHKSLFIFSMTCPRWYIPSIFKKIRNPKR